MLNKKNLILIAVLTSLIIAGSGYFYYHNLKKNIQAEKEIDLTAIAQLKISQLQQWIDERYADQRIFVESEHFINELEQFINNPTDEKVRSYIIDRISIPQQAYNYNSIFLVSPNNRLLISTKENHSSLNDALFHQLLQPDHNKINSHSYFSFDNGTIYYDIISPIFSSEGQIISFLIFRIDPLDYLYPFIQSWPTPSKTSETLLISKGKDYVLFLNELRHQNETALKLSIPLSQKTLPAVMAADGIIGIIEGTDYRGSDVIAYIAPVPGTDWFMVTKVDKKELLRELVAQGTYVILATILIITVLAFGIGLFYNLKQKNIYLSLWKTQEEFKTTLYSIGDAVITTDKAGIVKQINKIAEELTGWKEVNARNKPLSDIFRIINEYTGEPAENPVEKALKHGEIVGLANHTLLISKNGTKTPIADSAAPIHDSEGNVIGVVLVFRDQTDEKRHLEEIESARDFAENIIETLHESLLVLDEKLNVISANKTFFESFKVTPDKVLGESFFKIDNGAWYHTGLKEHLTNAFVLDKTHFQDYSVQLEFETVGIRTLNMNIRRIVTGNNQTKNILLAINDISEKEKLIKELTVAKDLAEKSNQLKTAFLANMSHEIRTPLNGILGFSSMIAEDELNREERETYLKIIENSGQRLLSIVNDILDISMIQSNQIKIKNQDFILTDFLKELFTFYKTLQKEKIKNLDFSVKYNSIQPNLIITSDKDRLFQVYKNLLDNAFKFTHSGFIQFGASQSNDLITCFVKDSGKGIPHDKVNLIFEKFNQGYNKQYIKNEGTGLGLPIAKGLVERLGGKIWVETEPEKGTAFFFNIPLN